MRKTKTITRKFDVTKGVAKVYKAGNDVLIHRPFIVFGESDPEKITEHIEVAPDERVVEVQVEGTIQRTYALSVEKFIRIAEIVDYSDTEEPKPLSTEEPKPLSTESEE